MGGVGLFERKRGIGKKRVAYGRDEKYPLTQ